MILNKGLKYILKNEDSIENIDAVYSELNAIYNTLKNNDDFLLQLESLIGKDALNSLFNTKWELKDNLVFKAHNERDNIELAFIKDKNLYANINNREIISTWIYAFMIMLKEYGIIEIKKLHKNLLKFVYWKVLDVILESYSKLTSIKTKFVKVIIEDGQKTTLY